MDKKKVVDRILKRLSEKKIDEFEIYLLNSTITSIEAKDGEVDAFKVAEDRGTSLRIFKRQSPGFSYATDLTPLALDSMVEQADFGASYSASDEFYSLPPVPASVNGSLNIFDPQLSEISEQEKIEKAKSLEKAAFSFDKKVKKVRKALYYEATHLINLVNSRGIDRSYSDSVISASIMVVAEEGNDSQTGYDFNFSHFLSDVSFPSTGEEAAKKAVEMLNARILKSTKCPVILDNCTASEFLDVLSSSFLAESVQKDKSLLKGKINTGIFSPLINIIDDGLYPGGISTAPFDGEGTPAQRTVVVKNGELKGFLYDTYCANKDVVSSTGNSGRGSLKMPPSVGISNFFIEKGKTSPEDMLKVLNKGLLIKEVMGIHTANPISGDFSVGISGFWIENGKIQYPVRGVTLSGNILDLFQKIEAVGSDFRLWGNIGSPSLAIGEMDIGGA